MSKIIKGLLVVVLTTVLVACGSKGPSNEMKTKEGMLFTFNDMYLTDEREETFGEVKSGEKFFVLNVTIENTVDKELTFSSFNVFMLPKGVSVKNHKIEDAILTYLMGGKGSLDNHIKLAPGESATGDLVFMVSEDIADKGTLNFVVRDFLENTIGEHKLDVSEIKEK